MAIKFSYANNEEKVLSFENYLSKLQYISATEISGYLKFYNNNNNKILESDKNKILIKGEVQSGKTNNIIYLISEYIKKSHRYFIFLTGHLNTLNFQNINRLKSAFAEINKDVMFINAKNKSITTSFITRKIVQNKDRILIFSGIKKQKYLNNIVDSIVRSNFSKQEIIIIDDEADSFSMSKTFLNARKNISNDSVIKYLSITATPYKNLYNFQKMYELYIVYNSHAKYIGLKKFLTKEMMKAVNTEKKYILLNLVFNAFKSNRDNCEIIWNTSRRKKDHTNEAYWLKEAIFDISEMNLNKILDRENLKHSDFKSFCRKINNNIRISNSDYEYISGKTAIVIGRENMSRGITYENLVSSYYFHDQEKYDPGVIMQAARWFGYRDDTSMVLINETLFKAYKECVVLEEITNNFDLSNNYKEIFDEQKFDKIDIKDANDIR